MISDILVFMDGRSSAENAAETAFLLASRHNARVEGLHVKADVRNFISHQPIYAGVDSLRQFSENFDRETASLEEGAHQLFCQARDNHGLVEQPGDDRGSTQSTALWNVVPGNLETVVCERARVFDVCVIGRDRYGSGNPTGKVIETVLFDSGRPVLIAPPHPPKTVGGYIIVAWNRSAASAKALSSALPLLDKAARVRLVYVDTGAKTGPSIEEAAAYVGRHGFAAEAVTIAAEGGSVASALLTDAQDADLLVMGAYSHSRFRDIVLGGVTREILQNAPLPVLMVH